MQPACISEVSGFGKRRGANPDRPTGPTPAAHTQQTWQTFPPPPRLPQVSVDVRPFAAPSAQPDLSLIAARDAQVDQVKQRHSEDGEAQADW